MYLDQACPIWAPGAKTQSHHKTKLSTQKDSMWVRF